MLIGIGQAMPAAAAQNPIKGSWAGPARTPLPGPGPAPGQAMADYFASLKTGPRSPAPHRVLVIGGTLGFRHDSTSTAMATIHRLGIEGGGEWDAELRTDFDLINAGRATQSNAGFQPVGLGDFDALVIVNAEGEWPLSPAQKAALLSFVRDEGKGLVVIHGTLNANHGWRDWIDMVGGEMTGHPFNTLDKPVRPFPLVNEDPAHPATRHLSPGLVKQDELYAVRNFTRADTDVLLRMDEARLDTQGIEDQLPPERDMPVAWSKRFDKGRVFVSSLGHTRESFADPDVAKLYGAAVRWVLGLTDGGVGPHARPPSGGPTR